MTDARAAERRAIALLGAGAAAGLAFAALGLLRAPGPEGGLPPGAVAAVNGELLRVEEYQRAVEALAADRRAPLGDAEKRHVLDRLLDEELLVQRGIELGLARHDPTVRADLVAAVIEVAVAESASTEPGADELESFYAANRAYFAREDRLRARQVWVRAGAGRSDGEARARAARAAERLRAGEDFAAVNAALGDDPVAPLPDDSLPWLKLRDYVGPGAAHAAWALEPGGVTDPVHSSAGFHVLQVVDRRRGRAPPLAEIRDEVRAELRRRAGDRALREYLDALRDRADVRIPPRLP